MQLVLPFGRYDSLEELLYPIDQEAARQKALTILEEFRKQVVAAMNRRQTIE